MSTLRATVPVKLVLGLLLQQPEVERYAFELAEVLDCYPATTRAVLRRLAQHGWLASREEEGDPVVLERPLRVYYRLIPEQVEQARAWLAAARPMPVLAPVDLS